MPLLVLPAMIGVLVDHAGMSDSSAGWSASAHFLASFVAGLVLSLRVHRLNLKRVATFALVIASMADVASALTAGETPAFFAARIVAGIMLGSVYIACVSAFARQDEYERGFGLFVTLQFVVSGLGLYLVPVYADSLGAFGLFAGFAVLDILALLLARFLPDDRAADAESLHGDPVSELRILLATSALLAILGFTVFEAANNAQFTYIERFGVALDISDSRIGIALLVASLVGIPGAFSIVVVGHRFGTLGPIVAGILVAVVGLGVLLSATTYTAYFFGSACMGFSWAFCLPFIQSFLAGIDRKGSAVAAGTSFSTFGSSIGPGIAAIVVMGGNYANVFRLSLGLFGLTLVAFMLADRTRRDAP